MKPFYYIALFMLFSVFTQNALSQDQPQQRRQTPRQRAAEKDSGIPSLSPRATTKNEEQTRNIDNVVWLREIYRWVDLKKENNAALYYPEQPIDNRMSLFTLVFKLMADGKVPGYRYLITGQENFTEENKVKFEDVLQDFQIYHTSQGSGNNVRYTINDSDIPNNEVLMYGVKEAYYFDQATGTYNTKVLAICPMLIRQEDEMGEPIRTPMFWWLYEDIRPYISRAFIMTSNINNALTYTIDDFFTKQMYKGDIVKTTNMMNLSLAQQVGSDPAVLKHAQDSIEGQLKFFEEKLWVPKDTTAVKSTKKDSKKNTEETKVTEEAKDTKTTKESKPKSKPKETKSQSSPTKSVRRTR